MNKYLKYLLISSLVSSITLGGLISYCAFTVETAYKQRDYKKAYNYLKYLVPFSNYYKSLYHEIVFQQSVSRFYKQEIMMIYGVSEYEELFRAWAFTLRDNNINVPIVDSKMKKLYDTLHYNHKNSSHFKSGVPINYNTHQIITDKNYHYIHAKEIKNLIKEVDHQSSVMFLGFCDVLLSKQYTEEFYKLYEELHESPNTTTVNKIKTTYEIFKNKFEKTIESSTSLQKAIYTYGTANHIYHTITEIYSLTEDNKSLNQQSIAKKILIDLNDIANKYKEYYPQKSRKFKELIDIELETQIIIKKYKNETH